MTAEPTLRVISLGAGVQSTTMALMAAHGEIGPMPDCAIFADTKGEPAAVYEHLRWLQSANVLPFPVHLVSQGSLLQDTLAGTNSGGKKRFASIPHFFDMGPEAENRVVLGRRQCTKEYKLDPLSRHYRTLLGKEPRDRIARGTVEVWVGISLDEKGRMKDARAQWITNRWPLIERRMSRGDCLEWLKRHGYPQPPKSACGFCPFRTNAEWRNLRENDPAAFADAILIDEAMRNSAAARGLRGVPFLHRSCQPLREVDFTDGDPRQDALFGFDYNECEGMCGV